MNDHTPGVTTRRWTEQRWLPDNVIRAVGITWDQPRTISYNTFHDPKTNTDLPPSASASKSTLIFRQHLKLPPDAAGGWVTQSGVIPGDSGAWPAVESKAYV